MTRFILALCLGVTGIALPATAACRLALALALDVSSSVDAGEYALQRDGLAAALNSRSVQELLFAGPDHVAVAVYEWSGQYQQQLVLDWTALTGPDALASATATISGARRSFDDFPTALGYAVSFGQQLIATAPPCDRRVLDVSGDGVTNHGFDPPTAYRHFPFGDIIVNGLVVQTTDPRVPVYYLNEVIRGPGAFVELAENYEDFERAMRLKLVREIGSVAIGMLGE